jgi:hypothetical protein
MPSSVVAAVAASAVTSMAEGWIAASILEAGFLGSAAGIFGTGLVASAVGGAAGFVVSTGMRAALGGGAESAPTSSPSFTAQAQQRTHVLRSTVATRQIVYGEVMVSGPLIFAASSSDNNTLHLVVALAGHECEAINAIYFNDEAIGTLDGNGAITDGRFAGKVIVKKHLGSTTQTADADLVAANVGWTTDHRLQGVAYLYLKFTYDRDVFPRGIPNIKAVVRGRKLYDPRTSTTAWSDNPALAIRDYLTASFGLACSSAEINDASFIAAANLSDEAVALAAGGTESRYTANGVVDLGSTPMASIESMLSACGGALVWTQGEYVLHGAAYAAPAITLTEDDLRSSIRVRPRVPRQELYNAVKGTYVDPEKYWQPGDFPVIASSTYATQDGAVIYRDVALPMTTSSATAQRLAKIMLEKSRQAIGVDFPAKATAFPIAVWDTVRLTISSLGWSAKEFKVVGWELSETGAVNLTLQEEAAACYAWSAEETIADVAPDTGLPDPFTIAAPGTPEVTESLFQTTGSAGVKARASMSWAATTDAFVVDYLPEYRLQGGTWVVLSATGGLTAEINDIAPGIYEFRVRARNAMGVRSEYSGTRTREVLGLTAPPGDASAFYVIAHGGIYTAEWALSGDLDVRIGGRAVIRHSTLTTGATWNDGIIVGEFNGDAVSGQVPLMAGTYMLKFQDSSGNWSVNTASFVPSDALLTGWTTVATSTQHPAFAGAKVDTASSGGELYIDNAQLIDSVTDLIDDWIALDWEGGIDPIGTYTFDTTMDCATVASRRFDATITAQSFDVGDYVDGRSALLDEWGVIDGSVVNDCDATLYIRTTNDNPAGSPTWGSWTPFFVGDFNCRAAQFRLDLTSGNPSHNIKVTALSARARIPA